MGRTPGPFFFFLFNHKERLWTRGLFHYFQQSHGCLSQTVSRRTQLPQVRLLQQPNNWSVSSLQPEGSFYQANMIMAFSCLKSFKGSIAWRIRCNYDSGTGSSPATSTLPLLCSDHTKLCDSTNKMNPHLLFLWPECPAPLTPSCLSSRYGH